MSSQAWTTFYYSSERFILFALLIAIAYQKKQNYFIKQFLIVAGGYNLMLGVLYIIKDFNLINSVSLVKNIAFMAIYLFTSTIVISINLYRYGWFKNS